MKKFKIIDRPYGSEAEFAYKCDDGYYITNVGTCIPPEDVDNYIFEEIDTDIDLSSYIRFTGTVYFQECPKCGARITSPGEPQVFNVPDHIGWEQIERALEKALEKWEKNWDERVSSFLEAHSECLIVPVFVERKMEEKVNKNDYFIFDYSGGYFGIVENKSLNCVFGGDPANEDDYDFEFVKMVFDKWDGTLVDGEIPYSHIAF